MKERYEYWSNLLNKLILAHDQNRTFVDQVVKAELADIITSIKTEISEIELKEKNLNLFSEENQSV